MTDPMADLVIGHQAMAMDHLNRDRCLLRRDMEAKQNQTYGLPQDNLETCHDDMGVHVGDSTNTVNHYHNEQSSQPACPAPVPGRIPRWLIVLLVIPWLLFAAALLWAVLNPKDPTTPPVQKPIIWNLEIGASNP